MKSFRLATVIAVTIFVFGRVSAAQDAYGTATIDIDQDSGTVTATCENNFDGALDGNYNAWSSHIGERTLNSRSLESGGSAALEFLVEQIQGLGNSAPSATRFPVVRRVSASSRRTLLLSGSLIAKLQPDDCQPNRKCKS